MSDIILVKGYERVNKSFTEGMDLLVGFHTVNILLGVICATIAAFNFYIFASTARFRQNYKILLALATADLVNTIAMTAMGANRRDVYNSVLKTLLIPIRNSWDCAIEPWLWLKGIGDIWPPVIQLCMGMERACSVTYPVFFRERVEKKSKTYHIRKIRYYILISLLASVLVSVPNVFSIFSAWIKEINNAIEKPAVWMACVNSAISPFVYFTFNEEYRQRCLTLLRLQHFNKKNVVTNKKTVSVFTKSKLRPATAEPAANKQIL